MYSESPFKYLYDSKNDQALLNATGVDHREFSRLLSVFGPTFERYTYDEVAGLVRKKQSIKKGRPRSLPAEGCLGLVLMWFRTTGTRSRTLPLIFGLTYTPMERWLAFGKKCLFTSLSEYKPTYPSVQKVEAYKAALSVKYRHTADVAFACDGVKLNIEKPGDHYKQSKYYNGWTHGHYVSCIFVFAPDGTIPVCALNAPGCLHDSTVAEYGGVYDKLRSLYDTFGAKTVVDSAFNPGDGNYLLKSGQLDPFDPHEVLRNRDATSIRQMSEWGMYQLKSKFPRMGDTLPYEEKGHRGYDLSLMVRLYNHQCSTIGMNQIVNTYMFNSSPERRYFGFANTDPTADAWVDVQFAG